MKMFVIAIAALSLSFGDLDLKGNNVQQSQTVITSIGSTMSYEPGHVSILGRGFDLVSQVKIDGQAVQVVRKTGNEIVIQPGIMDPGFYRLDLLRPGMRVTGTIEFAPTLRAARFGDMLRLVVNPGESGQVFVDWSYRCLETPAIVPGVSYMQMLDLTTPRCGPLSWSVSRDGEALVITAPVPHVIAGLELFDMHPQRGLNLQAFCIYDGDMCFTNMATVPPYNLREGSLQFE
jgi:hypothetical protein